MIRFERIGIAASRFLARFSAMALLACVTAGPISAASAPASPTASAAASAASTATTSSAAAAPATTSSTASAPSTGAADSKVDPEVHGYVQTRFRGRHGLGLGGNEYLYQYVSLQVGDESQDVSGELFFRGTETVDKQRPPGDPLRGMDDTFGDPFGRLYYGHVDIKNLGFVDKLRIGRQTIQDVPGIYFDGLRVEDEVDSRTHYSVYAGNTVHLYEPAQDGDWVLGFDAEHSATDRLKLRLDLARVRDRFSPFGLPIPRQTPGRVEADTMAALAAFYDLNSHVDLDAKALRIDDRFRSVSMRGNFRYPGDRLYFTLSAERQPSAFFGQATEFSPMFDVLGSYNGYTQLSLSGSKGLFEGELDLNFGYTNRNSDSGAGAPIFNQDFDRWYAGLFLPEVLGNPKVSLAINYDRYLAQTSEFSTIGGEMGYAFNRQLKFAAGSSYSLYQFDPLTGLLRDNVREYYLTCDWKSPERDWGVRSRLVAEPFQDGGQFRTLELSVKHDF
ncbi:MAG: hypothetical protein HY303_10710 [Candidatus Wallbacteria bacterium]|nr:hypothetical protein [Candidatus Wallbacteria bacterium]